MIIDWKESWENERKNRISVDPKRICTFGIKPLDDALVGFLPDDLIVFAADSGTGKTQIGQDVAVHNAINGRNVALVIGYIYRMSQRLLLLQILKILWVGLRKVFQDHT